jgi:hypothetical protein
MDQGGLMLAGESHGVIECATGHLGQGTVCGPDQEAEGGFAGVSPKIQEDAQRGWLLRAGTHGRAPGCRAVVVP